MSCTSGRILATTEAIAAFGLIATYIWYFQEAWPGAALVILALFFVSERLRKANCERLGFSRSRLRSSLRLIGWPILLVAGAIAAGGILLGTNRNLKPLHLVFGMAAYCVWGILQQYLLNGFLVNRLVEGRIPGVPVVAGILFALLHYPNPFLMAVTLAGGVIAALVYLRYRDLLILGLAHGVIGTLLFVSVPDGISHSFNVGPDYLDYCRQAGHSGHLALQADPNTPR